MNAKFVEQFEKGSKSVYSVSKQTGIPYTTLSELLNGKIDINKCAVGMVYRLSLYFDCRVEDLLNKEPLITNASGTYRKIKYKWEKSQTPGRIQLRIWDRGQEKVIDESTCSQARFYSSYKLLTETVIDAFLQQKQAEELLNG